MEALAVVIVLVSALLISILDTFIGFGCKVMLIAVLNFFISIKEAIVISAIFAFVQYIFLIYGLKRNIDRELLVEMVWFLVPGIVLGLLLFKIADTSILSSLFSVFLIIYALYKLFKISLKTRLNRVGLNIGIFIFGVLEASIGAAGPLLAALLLKYGKTKQKLVALASAVLLISGLVRMIGYSQINAFYINSPFLVVGLIFIPLVGTAIGKRLLNRMPVPLFKHLAYLIILLVGLINLV